MAVALLVLAVVPAAGETANATSHQLIYMAQVRPIEITPQSVSVQTDGRASVIDVIGELTIPTPNRFRLTPARLARLRGLIARSGIGHLGIEQPIPIKREMYTLIAGTHRVRVVEGHIPARMRPLISFLSALIWNHI